MGPSGFSRTISQAIHLIRKEMFLKFILQHEAIRAFNISSLLASLKQLKTDGS